MYVGLLTRAWFMRQYKASQSSAFRDRNMILLLVIILDRFVGGERTLISMAVPRRMGTSGVNSRPTSGLVLLSFLPPAASSSSELDFMS